MRCRSVIAAGIVAALCSAPAASAHGVDAPRSHGPDPQAVDRGPEAPAPSGGPRGRPLHRAAVVQAARRSRRRQSKLVTRSLPSTWCGEVRSTDDARHERDTGGPRYHAVYMVPSDRRQRLRKLASTLQRDAMQASALLERKYGRAIRFDMGTRCGPQYLDISVVRTAESAAEIAALAATEHGMLEVVTRALRANGFDAADETLHWPRFSSTTRNYLVWFDGPGPAGTCGEATRYDDPVRDPSNVNNQGGRFALVYRLYGRFCGSNTVRHEITHNLGAVQSRAPNLSTGAHCDDAYEDAMCDVSAPRRLRGEREEALFFDYGNDDYWDPPAGPPLPWWTVNLSRFLCPTATCNVPTGRGARAR